MFSRIRVLSAALLLTAAGGAQAAQVAYSFDTVTKFFYSFDGSQASIVGVLRNTSTPSTVALPKVYQVNFNSCLPLLLTMMEKPGRYYFNIVIEDTTNYSSPLACGLELR